jgi:hypothetical protein
MAFVGVDASFIFAGTLAVFWHQADWFEPPIDP